MNLYTPARRADPATGGPSTASHEIKYREDAASYVAAMLAELRHIAGKAGFDKLVKSLDAAYYDAYGALDAKARETAPPPRSQPPQPAPEQNPEKTFHPTEPNAT